MKAHEAIMLGSMVITPRSGRRHHSRGEGCALGMLEVAMGQEIIASDGIFASVRMAEELFPWLTTTADFPCKCEYWGGLDVSHAIMHVFDFHVAPNDPGCNREVWTLEQLIDWVRSVDPTISEEVPCQVEELAGQSV